MRAGGQALRSIGVAFVAAIMRIQPVKAPTKGFRRPGKGSESVAAATDSDGVMH